MATFTERIQFVVEAVTGNAEKNLKGLRSEVGKAEGVTGKLKTAFSGAGAQISGALTAGLAAGGAAIGAFVINGVQQFADMAREAGRLADTTGLATEEASRFLAVLRPLGVEGADLADILGNINSKAAEGRLAELGVQAEGSNERLIKVIELLGSITDETQRALLANELLGEEGTRQLAPLIASAGELRKKLADVSEQQVISDEEREKAAKFDATMKELDSTVKDVSLTIGETLIPVLNEIAPGLKGYAEAIGFLDRQLQNLPGPLGAILSGFRAGPLGAIAGGANWLFGGGSGPTSNATMAPPGTPGISAAAATVNVTVNNPPGTDGRQVAADIQNYYRSNGQANTSGLP